MSLIDAAQLKVDFEFASTIGDERLTRSISEAARRVKTLVGADAYADAAAPQPQDAERADAFRYAEAHYAMHLALLGLNSVVRPGGVQQEEITEGNGRNVFLRSEDLRKQRFEFLRVAFETLSYYSVAAQSELENLLRQLQGRVRGAATLTLDACPVRDYYGTLINFD